MKTYTVKEGKHFSFPRVIRFKFNPKKITWTIKFNENCNYIIKDNGKVSNDQKDWNKLCGIFFHLFNTRKNTAMIGWRYNEKTDLIELAPYYHVNGGRDLFPPMMTVKREEEFKVVLQYNRGAKRYIWFMQKNGETQQHAMPFTHSRRWCGFINFYFGGNREAPQRMSVQMDREVD